MLSSGQRWAPWSALVLYWAGARLGQQRLERIADRVPFVERTDLHRAEAWFERHGGTAVLFGRGVPVVRSLVSVPAGVERMSVVRFIVFTALGSVVYNAALITAGYLLGGRWTEIGKYSDSLNFAIYAAMLAAVLVFVRRRLRRRRADEEGSARERWTGRA